MREVLTGQAFAELPITMEHALALIDLPVLHRDPFYRMLVTQAEFEGLTVVTRDPTIPRYDVGTVAA